jgi:hypothetical protein
MGGIMTNTEMDIAEKVKPTIVVIFGGCGDLTNRKLMPALLYEKAIGYFGICRN